MNNKAIGGIVTSVIGLIGIIVMADLISRDVWYIYTSPLSSNEVSMIAMVVVSAIVLINCRIIFNADKARLSCCKSQADGWAYTVMSRTGN